MALHSSPPARSLSSPSHSSRFLEEIAARVIDEFLNDQGKDSPVDYFEEEEFVIEEKDGEDEDEDEDEKEFEFPLIARNWISFPSPADEIFYNGGILPIYPVFNTDLLLDAEVIMEEDIPPVPVSLPEKEVIRMPLRMLFKEDLQYPSSSASSSEVDELDGISPGTYCVWNPNKVAAADAAVEEVVVGEKRWRKSSSSTGVSRRWKLKDLIHRSNSEGRSKGRFVFLTPSNSQSKRIEELRQF